MWFFLFIWIAISIFVCANPIPDELADSIDLNSDTASFSIDADVDTTSTITNSVSSLIVATEPGPHCDTDAFVDDNIETKFQKRFKECPAYPIPQAPSPLQHHHPTNDPQKSTSTENDPCGDAGFIHYLSCGGPEVTAISTFIATRPPFFADTDQIAEFCCKTFNNEAPLYDGLTCQKLTPEKHIFRMTAQEMLKWVRMRLDEMKRIRKPPSFWDQIQNFLNSPL